MNASEIVALLIAALGGAAVGLERRSASGVLASAAILGLTDVDALTLSMAREVAWTTSAAVAATGIAIGVLTNTAMKLGLALFLGSRQFKLIAGGALALMLVALGAMLTFSLS